jgi:hypothetical protein
MTTERKPSERIGYNSDVHVILAVLLDELYEENRELLRRVERLERNEEYRRSSYQAKKSG